MINDIQIPDFSWEFIEKWYPGYTQSNEIAYNDDLEKIINDPGDIEEGDGSDNLLKRFAKEKANASTILEYALVEKGESDLMLYNRAVQNFVNTKLAQMHHKGFRLNDKVRIVDNYDVYYGKTGIIKGFTDISKGEVHAILELVCQVNGETIFEPYRFEHIKLF
tara:strand:+ start:608 stop:1099 length:492 start_codon:yes stop_codon:yes gene_type:complete